jgi:hypothetical protein
MYNQVSKKQSTMNSTEKEIFGFMGDAERMSGFDSYDSYDGDEMSYFDDDMSYFDDDAMSYASGQQAQAVSDPYVIQYENTTLGTLQAVMFGYNDFFGASPQFGNPVGITVTNLQGGSYGRLLAQSNNKFFKIGKWRFQSANTSQLSQTLTLTHYDANGKQYSTPLNLSIMRDAYQFQNDILDVTKPVTIDGNSQITFPLLATTIFVISIFPTSVISGKAVLNGGTSLNSARAPRLSGKNVAPVIIQTTQGVAGISKS